MRAEFKIRSLVTEGDCVNGIIEKKSSSALETYTNGKSS